MVNFFKSIFIVIVFIIVFILVPFSRIYALKTPTHMNLNEYIVRNELNGFNIDLFFKSFVGFDGGINQNILNHKAYRWIVEGGETEDEFPRYLNHFHDPLTNEGLWLLNGNSAIDWAFMEIRQQNYGGTYSWKDARQDYYNALTCNSYVDPVENQFWRDTYMSWTLRALGQLMHLVEDMSVPAHARDDAHILDEKIFTKYETWIDINGRDREPNFGFENPKIANFFRLRNCENLYGYLIDGIAPFVNIPGDIPLVFFDPVELCAVSKLSNVSASNLFDNEKYTESNLNPAITTGADIGLSEYSNANFLSASTIFDFYEYPIRDHCDLIEYVDPVTSITSTYLSKSTDGETVMYFAKCSRYYKYLPSDLNINGVGIKLDDRVRACYAQKLIPRAIGYSSQLLHYFFRGKIEISLPDDGFYAMTNQEAPEDGFISFKLLAQNISDWGEEMTGGFVDLVVKYKTSPDGCDPFTNDSIWNAACSTQNLPFEYVTVPYPEMVTIPRAPAQPIELEFILTDPIPLWATDVYIYLVYRGQLGNEGNVNYAGEFDPGEYAVAVGFKDISEPTPIHIFNNMDKICLDTISPQGNRAKGWFDAGLPAITRVDTWEINKYGNNNGKGDEYDVYSHRIHELYVRFSSTDAPQTVGMNEGEYHYYFEDIPPGTLLNKMYLLTDSAVNSVDPDPGNNMPDVFSIHVSLCFSTEAVEGPLKAEHDALWDHYTIWQKINGGMTSEFTRKAVWNQWIVDSNGDYNRVVSLFNYFREHEMWGGTRILNPPYHPDIFCDPENPVSHCPMDDLNEP